jgi:Pyridoxal-phosphate dependent enzyme
MRKSDKQQLPELLLRSFRRTFREKQTNREFRAWSHNLLVHLNRYLRENLDRDERLADIADRFGQEGISETTLRRAFRPDEKRKKGYGGARELWDLICIYLYGFDFNEFLETHFPDYLTYQFESQDFPDSTEFGDRRVKNYLIEDVDLSDTFDGKLSPLELQVRDRQLEKQRVDFGVGIDPEFPPAPFYTPDFPASKTRRIQVSGFSNVWLKDESTLPVGIHKSRMAWELVKLARELNVKEFSLISSGGAAIAIQFFFDLFNVGAKLKVLVDNNISPDVKAAMEAIGCDVTSHDLGEKQLTSKEICALTKNESGIDLTYREIPDPNLWVFYNWCSFEIINEAPDYCFLPFGSGDLYTNLLRIIWREAQRQKKGSNTDNRLQVPVHKIKRCHYVGATTTDPQSKLDKLYSHYLPTRDAQLRYLSLLRQSGVIGTRSAIIEVAEEFVDKAMKIAERQNITCEYSSIAGLALLLQNRNQIPSDAKILIVSTGKTILYPEEPDGKHRT